MSTVLARGMSARVRLLRACLVLGWLAACSTTKNPTTAKQEPLGSHPPDVVGSVIDAQAADDPVDQDAAAAPDDAAAPGDSSTPDDGATPQDGAVPGDAGVPGDDGTPGDVGTSGDVAPPIGDAPTVEVTGAGVDGTADPGSTSVVDGTGSAAKVACDPCASDAECAGLGAGAACIGLGEPAGSGGHFCAAACASGGKCDAGYTCGAAKSVSGGTATVCSPNGNACGCSTAAIAGKWTTPCVSVLLDATGLVVSQCPGTWSCSAGGKPLCDAPEPAPETCNGIDDDCDGLTDEGADLCDDGNACTTGDACKAGKCEVGLNTCECKVDADCKPAQGANLCLGTLACTAGKCVVQAGTSVTCDASQDTACSKGACDPKTGKCAAVAQNDGGPCDADGDACTVGDKCDAGKCLAGKAPSCDDANPCTTDACDKATGCTHTNNSAACNDGNGCTGGEACKNGGCSGGVAKVCDDGNPCTVDACDPTTGACGTSPAGVNGKACDDGDACTIDDVCDSGKCKGGKQKPCDDGNPCTLDACAAGTCGSVPGDGACDDGNACTQGDKCAAGKCAGGANVCECSQDGDCAAKSDGNLCAGKHVCVGNKCTIAAGTAVVCDKGKDSACATNTCDGKTGQCAMVAGADGKACDDGSACTAGDACKVGTCGAGAAVLCDDANPCTDDTCDAAKGCVHMPNAASCSDGNACTASDACKAGSCQGTATNCDDGSSCTADGCDAKAGVCTHTVLAGCVGKKWQRAIGGAEDENFYGVVHTSDGGFVAAGHTTGWSAGGMDALLVKVDACGNLVWSKTFGGAKDDLFWGLSVTKDGGIIATGGSASWPGTYVVKTDGQGNAQWQNVYGGGGFDFARRILPLKNGGYVFITEQYTYSDMVGKMHKATVTKIDDNGAVVWVHSYGGAGPNSQGDAPFDIVELTDGSLVITGGEESDSLGEDDVWMLKLDSMGKVLVSRLYGVDSDDECAGMVATSDGGFLMTGHTTGWGAIYHSKDVLVVKVDANLNLEWAKRFGGFDDDRGADAFETPDGYVITGRTGSFGASKDTGTKWVASSTEKYNPNVQMDMFFAKIDKQGTLKSMKIYGNAYTQYGFAGDVDGAGGFIFAGQTFGLGSGKADGFLVKTDANGDAGGTCDTTVLDLATVNQATCTMKTHDSTPTDFGGGIKLPSSPGPGVTPTPVSTAICVCQ
jgi:hypothetical protein